VAIVPVQALKKTQATAATSDTFVLATQGGASPALGNLLIVGVAFITKPTTLTSVTDDGSNTWQNISGTGSSTSGSAWLAGAFAPRNTMTQFTINASGSTKYQIAFLEIPVYSPQGDISTSTDDTVATTNPASSIIPTFNSDFCVALLGAVATATSVAGGFTRATGAEGGGAGLQLSVAYNDTETGATLNPAWTQPSQIDSTTIATMRLVRRLPRNPIMTQARPWPVNRASRY
jgi:hypothetical protein